MHCCCCTLLLLLPCQNSHAPHVSTAPPSHFPSATRQVSRRLQRRLHKELAAGHFGYVKLAVAAYDGLLLSNRPEKSNLLANELVVRTVVKRRT